MPGDGGIVALYFEELVKFDGLCETRGIPVLRIGVADGSASTGSGTDARLEIQGVASWSLTELAGVHEGTLHELLG